jgi:GDP-mannose 6-dehydrogenase
MKSPEVLTALEAHTRPDQLLLDIALLPDHEALRAQYHGMCW